MTRRLLTAALYLLLAGPLLAQDAPETEAKDDDYAEVFNRVVPVFDPGSHTRPICGLGFTTDKSKLITVGEDSTVQVWSTQTGERLDILRLPAYGHEQGFNAKVWDVAAVSRDGKYVAIGGGQKQSLTEGTKTDRAKLVLVDVFQRTLRPITAPPGVVTALAFSSDGNRLAVASSGKTGEIYIYSGLTQRPDRQVRRRKAVVLSDPQAEKAPTILAFSPDGSRLLSAAPRSCNLWDLDDQNPRLLKKMERQGQTTAFSWAPDGKRFARTWMSFLNHPMGFEIRTAEGELEKEILFDNQAPFTTSTHAWSVNFTGPQSLVFSTCEGRPATGTGPAAYRFDLSSSTGVRLFEEPAPASSIVLGTVSEDREYAAITVSMGLDAVIYRVQDGSVVTRCGAESPVPTTVGWSVAGKPAGIAWTEKMKIGRFEAKPEDLDYAFDLTQMEPVAQVAAADYAVVKQSLGEWNISHRRTEDGPIELTIDRAGKTMSSLRGGANMSAYTLVPQGDAQPLVAWNTHGLVRGTSALVLSRLDGTVVAKMRPEAVHFSSVVPSPDGRYLIAATGTHRLCIYTTDGEQFPLISIARVKGEWVAWSGDGFYTASPGGEKMIGWSVSNGPDKLATFHTAEKFSKHFRRPDLLRRAIELGSMKLALQQVETRAPDIEQILPPHSELKLVNQTGSHVQIQAAASPGARDKPVVAMRVLLDGRPLPAGLGYKVFQKGEPTTATWEFDIPSGNHELKLLARGDDSSAVSAPLIVNGPKSADHQPVLHRLCIGINTYKLSALNLTSAAKDAADVYGALERHCVGADNRFGAARGALLVDKQATRPAVLKAIGDIRKSAKPGDLVVILFAGHGLKQQEEYFLLTHEANPNESLKGQSLSGEDLRQSLADMECPVLLLMDACHSARGVKSFRPATDDLTRNLTDDSAGVTVLAAAMAHEVASATEENGHFTAALLKALQAGRGVPYDPYDHVLYTHHIYSVIFSEVRKATNGKQNPFLNMPWTVPPLGLRDVPHE